MSILIHDMKMPTRCWDCPMCYDMMACTITGLNWYRDTVDLSIDPVEERMPNCPLIEIPPHGDLVDRDHLSVVCYTGTEGLEDTFDNGVAWTLEYIDKLTPVIPAEGGADNA